MTDAAERARLRALHALRILDTPAEERFDRITRTAARVMGAPMALINLVDHARQWTKSCVGLARGEVPREQSFCATDIGLPGALVVPDATRDPRFRDNPMVLGDPHIRFYAGIPVRSADGSALGRLCVVDTVARVLRPGELEALADLVPWVELELHERVGPTAPGDALALMQERFISVAAHELRTPLTAIRGYSEELLDPLSGPLDDDQREAADAIARGSVRLSRLVDDLLFTLELDAGRVPLEPASVAVDALAAAVREDLATEAAARGVEVAVEVPAGETVPGDPDGLRRAIGAVVRNAITWSPEGGTVRVDVVVVADELRLTVSDEGPGLPEAESSSLGLRFRRMRGGEPREGAGLGLAICRGIVELHGGRLAAGTAPGGGAAVSIILPREMPTRTPA